MPPSRGRSRHLSTAATRNPTSSSSQPVRLPPFSQLPRHLLRIAYGAVQLFRGLSLKTKAILALCAILYAALIIALIRIGTHGILEYLSGFALYFSHSPAGPVVLLLIITALSLPPLMGYGTSITLCGLSFGSPESGKGHGLLFAWTIAAAGCLLGSTLAFLVCRWGLATVGDRFEWIRQLRGGQEWKAMEKAVERKGWKMAVLIRLCPFPFVYSNLFFSSLRPSSISLPLFLLATLCTTPKLMIHVFVGSKAFEAIQSGKNGADATKANPWISVASMVGASLLGAATSWYIYRETKRVLDSFVEEDEEEQRINAEEQGRNRHGDAARGGPGAEDRYQRPAADDSWGWSDDETETQKRRSRNGGQGALTPAPTPFTVGDAEGEIEDGQGAEEPENYAYGGKDEAKRSLLGRDSRGGHSNRR